MDAQAEAERRWPKHRSAVIDHRGPGYHSRKAFLDGVEWARAQQPEPQVVTTAAELDALPEWSVVISEQGGVFEREDAYWWRETGFTSRQAGHSITLPATVIYRPDERGE